MEVVLIITTRIPRVGLQKDETICYSIQRTY